ncbi:MAG: hypothetical protein ACRD2X_10125, partial [Vicinamibacteraceae bacterium]
MGLRSKDVAKLIVWVGSVLLPASQSSSRTLTDLELPAPYAQTAWPSLHRDSRNSDFAPFFMPARHRFSWSRLEGAAVLPAPVIGPAGHLYVTTGRGPGTSHLHAFDRSGNLLWESPPQRSMADLDSAACFSAPLIDTAGDLYLGDRDQLWAFHSDGQVKWSVPISGGGPFASLAFTKEGFVLGVSAGGAVLVFRREDGGLAAPPLDLPGGAGPVALTACGESRSTTI